MGMVVDTLLLTKHMATTTLVSTKITTTPLGTQLLNLMGHLHPFLLSNTHIEHLLMIDINLVKININPTVAHIDNQIDALVSEIGISIPV